MNAINVNPMANQFKTNQFGQVTDFYGNHAGFVNRFGDATIYGNTYYNSVNRMDNCMYDNYHNKIGDLRGYDAYERNQQTYYNDKSYKKDLLPELPKYDPPSYLNKNNKYDDDYDDDYQYKPKSYLKGLPGNFDY
jgi:hypothetical protein